MTRFELVTLTATIAALAPLATIADKPLPRLVWNLSASAPPGLYLVNPGAPIKRGDMVVAWLPPRWRDLAARRRYLPSNVPLVKQVAGIAGNRICAGKRRITINGRPAAERLSRDVNGRPLPAWSGCITLMPGELFLLNAPKASFDGRYVGVTRPEYVIGKARLLWRG